MGRTAAFVTGQNQLPRKPIRRSSVTFIRYPSRVPETTVFGTLQGTPQNPRVYAWNSVPKLIPKSKFQNLTNLLSFGTFVT
jgi:hypothetical protein